MTGKNKTVTEQELILSKLDLEPKPGNLIPALQALQDAITYLPKEAIAAAAQWAGVPMSRAYAVATFYHQFRLRPVGRHQVQFCFGTACHIKGAPTVNEAFAKESSLIEGETTKDGRFTVHKVRCLGACSMAPVVKIDNDIFGKMNPSEIRKVISKYR
jgi:NADH-quinone oxidoreductase subunit E